ncbi:MAG TPA: hypothetical protein VFC68_07030, partial [Treponemataceae bacterium]|nr:hypothetical protein [Treponemataceae bacterium]
MQEKVTISIIALMIISSCLFANEKKPKIDFYGTHSSVQDTNTLLLTQDLFFTQLSNTQRFSINDLRNTQFDKKLLDSPFTSEYVFYMDITQKETDWICVLHLISKDTKIDTTYSRTYPGYY